jgi:hypothetical protein
LTDAPSVCGIASRAAQLRLIEIQDAAGRSGAKQSDAK